MPPRREGMLMDRWGAWRRTVRVWGALIACVVFAGCQTIPDISTWNQSTKDFLSAVTEGFHAAAGVNGEIARRLEKVAEKKEEYKDTARRYASVAQALEARGDDYEKLFGAITDYSGSLAALARAADVSQQTVDAVAGSLNTLVEAVGGTRLAGAGFELGKALANEVIKIKAAHDFGEAVQKADPVIGRISDLLIKDLEDLRRAVGVTKDEAIRAALQVPFEKQLAYRAALERRREYLQEEIKKKVAPDRTNPGDPLPPTQSLLSVDDAAELAKVEQYLRDAEAWYAPLKDERERALTVRAKSEELAVHASRAVGAWRASHASLASAVKERRLPESGRLAVLAVRIRALVADIKKEK